LAILIPVPDDDGIVAGDDVHFPGEAAVVENDVVGGVGGWQAGCQDERAECEHEVGRGGAGQSPNFRRGEGRVNPAL
jgi:hypothetical protein